MTVSSTTTSVSYTGNGSTTAFSVTFPFLGTGSSSELTVVERTIATGAEVTKVYTTDYTVTGGSGSTGTVTAVSAPASTVEWHIRRNTTTTQTTDYVTNDPFAADTVEDNFDRLAMAAQERDEDISQSFKYPDTYTGGASTTMPEPGSSEEVLKWNSAGTALENGPTASEITNAQTYANNASTSATAAASSASAASTSATNAATSETNAAASATAAAAAAASNLVSKVSEKSTDYTVVADTDDGTFFVADSSGGNVAFTLPSIATAQEGERYMFFRTSASNAVTLVRDGTDTINGVAGTYTMNASVDECILIVADDATPDNWIVVPWSQSVADESTLTKSANTISIASGGVDTTQLADDAVDPTKAIAGRNTQTGTTYTLALTDNLKTVTMNNASANTLTIPTNASVAFTADETRIDIAMLGAGVTTVTGDTGVTVNGVSAGSGALAQYGACSLLKIGTDTWLCIGLDIA